MLSALWGSLKNEMEALTQPKNPTFAWLPTLHCLPYSWFLWESFLNEVYPHLRGTSGEPSLRVSPSCSGLWKDLSKLQLTKLKLGLTGFWNFRIHAEHSPIPPFLFTLKLNFKNTLKFRESSSNYHSRCLGGTTRSPLGHEYFSRKTYISLIWLKSLEAAL